MRDINSGLLFSGVLTSLHLHLVSILYYPFSPDLSLCQFHFTWPLTCRLRPANGRALRVKHRLWKHCSDKLRREPGPNRSQHSNCSGGGVQRPSSPPLMWSTQCDKPSEVPTLWQNRFNFEKTLRRDKMNKLPHIMTVFISKSQITRCCRARR